MVDTDAEVVLLRAEVDRLRRLVGPCEQFYDDLRADLVAAQDAVKSAEHTAGELRGELAEAYTALDRAWGGGPALVRELQHVKKILGGTFVGRAYRAARRTRRRARYSAEAGVR